MAWQRGESPRSLALRSECLRGHPLPENLYTQPNGRRVCRRCRSEDTKQNKAKRPLQTCGVPECVRMARRGFTFCAAHLQRKERLGSATARRCYRCQKLYEDPELAQGSGTCPRCFLQRTREEEFRERNRSQKYPAVSEAAKAREARKRERKPPRTCSIKGCASVHSAKGLCRMHYQRSRKIDA